MHITKSSSVFLYIKPCYFTKPAKPEIMENKESSAKKQTAIYFIPTKEFQYVI